MLTSVTYQNPAHNVSVNNSNLGSTLTSPNLDILLSLWYHTYVSLPCHRSGVSFRRVLSTYTVSADIMYTDCISSSPSQENICRTLFKILALGSKEVVLFQLSVKETTNSSSCLGHGTPTKYAVPYQISQQS